MKKLFLIVCCFSLMNSYAETKPKNVRSFENDVYYTPSFEKKTENTHAVQNDLQILLNKQQTAYKVGVTTLIASAVFSGVGGILMTVGTNDISNTNTLTASYVLFGISGASALASGVSFVCTLGYQVKINKAISVDISAGRIALNF